MTFVRSLLIITHPPIKIFNFSISFTNSVRFISISGIHHHFRPPSAISTMSGANSNKSTPPAPSLTTDFIADSEQTLSGPNIRPPTAPPAAGSSRKLRHRKPKQKKPAGLLPSRRSQCQTIFAPLSVLKN